MTSTSTVIVKDSPQKAKSEPSVDSANNQVQTDGLVQMLCDYQVCSKQGNWVIFIEFYGQGRTGVDAEPCKARYSD